MARIADELWTWRHQSRLSQAEAAAVLLVSLSTYSRWERAVLVPSYRDLQRLRERFWRDGVRPEVGGGAGAAR